MGGKAFPNLNVPRLTHEEYSTLLQKCTTILNHHYAQVLSPPEAPEKPDHGDVDILVSTPLTSPVNIDQIASAFSAVQRTKVGVTTSFAVPHPTDNLSFAQIDVHVCREGSLEWERWMGGYGDLVQIVGMLNRGCGLTMTDRGLFVRIPEIEEGNRKASRLFLTQDYVKVMEFLGLDVEEYERGFERLEDIYRWCAGGRFYGFQRRKSKSDTEEDDKPVQAQANANDRKRLRKRPMFAQFVQEWMPSHPEAFKQDNPVEREVVLKTAIEYFHVEREYNEMMNTWKGQQNEFEIIEAIRKTILPLGVEGERLRRTIRGLKRWTSFQNGMPYFRDEDDALDLTSASWLHTLTGEDQKAFLDWVSINHAECRRREKARMGSNKANKSGDVT